MTVRIISLGFAVPPNSYSQEEVFQVLNYPRHFQRLFRDTGITKRHFWVPLSVIRELSWQQQQEEYLKGAVSTSLAAIRNCLDAFSPTEVGCVVFGSCTGFAPGPTIPHLLAKELGFLPNTYYTNIASMGCESGFPGLKRAFDYVCTTGGIALVVNCELASCTYFPEEDGKADSENDYELLRSNAIFSDAASAALVGVEEKPDWHHPIIEDMETYTNPEYSGDLGFTWRDGRLRVLLSKRVPVLAPEVTKPAIEAVLRRNGLEVSDITWFVIHAAGNKVLDNIRDALGIPEEKMKLTRSTLRDYGNTSSTSVGITGKRLMSENIKQGDYILMVSVGPGMTGGATLLRFS